MVFICVNILSIDKLHMYNLTINKEYTPLRFRQDEVLITNDGCTNVWYPIKNFKTKQKIRNEIITEILK